MRVIRAQSPKYEPDQIAEWLRAIQQGCCYLNLGCCFFAIPVKTRPTPVLIVRSSSPLCTSTKWEVDVIVPVGTGRTRDISPVQSAFIVYDPLMLDLFGMITPFRLAVVICEASPFPSKVMTPTSPTGPTGPAETIDPVVEVA